jgi:hypothetical protein
LDLRGTFIKRCIIWKNSNLIFRWNSFYHILFTLRLKSKLLVVLLLKTEFYSLYVQGGAFCNIGNGNQPNYNSYMDCSSTLGIHLIFGNYFNTSSTSLYAKCKGWKFLNFDFMPCRVHIVILTNIFSDCGNIHRILCICSWCLKILCTGLLDYFCKIC